MHGNNACLWKSVTDTLASEIYAGSFDGKARFLSTSDISERFGISNITSRRVLSELAGMDLIEKGRGKGCLLKRHAVNPEILVTADFIGGMAYLGTSYIFREELKGMAEAAVQLKLQLVQVTPSYIKILMDSPVRKRLTNVIVMQCEIKDAKVMEFLSSPEANAAFCHAHAPIKGIPAIGDDLLGGTKLVMEHLIGRGHRRIALLTKPCNEYFQPRFDGYYRALQENGIELRFPWIKELPDDTPADCAKAIDELLAEPELPSAVFAATDVIAMNAIDHLIARGLKAPADMAVAGFDNRPEGRIFKVPLTTVDLNWQEQGRQAVRLVHKRMHERGDAKFIAVEPTLVVRESA